MTRPIKTVKRQKWHHPKANYQAQDADGEVWQYRQLPTLPTEGDMWLGVYAFGRSRKGRPPEDFRTTLRRIVDPPKKPKRKMQRIWYFQDNNGPCFSESRKHARNIWKASDGLMLDPGPIESALIPAPRRKGK